MRYTVTVREMERKKVLTAKDKARLEKLRSYFHRQIQSAKMGLMKIKPLLSKSVAK